MAAGRYHYQVTVFLLQQGATLRQPGRFLSKAIAMQDRRWIQLLVEHGANLNDPTLARSAVAFAIDQNCPGMIKFLVENGATPNGMYAHDRTLLLEAVTRRNVQLVKALIDSGANPDTSPVASIRSPLHVAVYNGDDPIVQCLLSKMCDMRGFQGTESLRLAITEEHASVARTLVKAGADFQSFSLWQQSQFLVKALRANSLDMTKFLRQAGATLTASDAGSVLEDALLTSNERMAQDSLDCGADPNGLLMFSSTSPLTLVAGLGKPSLIRLLLKNHANPNDDRLSGGSKCLQKALDGCLIPSFASEDCVRILVQGGARTNDLSKWYLDRLQKIMPERFSHFQSSGDNTSWKNFSTQADPSPPFSGPYGSHTGFTARESPGTSPFFDEPSGTRFRGFSTNPHYETGNTTNNNFYTDFLGKDFLNRERGK